MPQIYFHCILLADMKALKVLCYAVAIVAFGVIDYQVTSIYNNFLGGNLLTLVIFMISIPAVLLVALIHYLINRCNREMGVAGWSSFLAPLAVTAATYAMPVLTVWIAEVMRNEGLQTFASTLIVFRFWSLILPVSIFIIWTKIPRGKVHFDRD